MFKIGAEIINRAHDGNVIVRRQRARKRKCCIQEKRKKKLSHDCVHPDMERKKKIRSQFTIFMK